MSGFLVWKVWSSVASSNKDSLLIPCRMSFSPEMRQAGLSSCFGRLDEKESR